MSEGPTDEHFLAYYQSLFSEKSYYFWVEGCDKNYYDISIFRYSDIISELFLVLCLFQKFSILKIAVQAEKIIICYIYAKKACIFRKYFSIIYFSFESFFFLFC